MSDPAQLPEARRAEALKKIEERENGIRAAAIKQGRQLERADLFKALGAQSIEEASQLHQLRKERDARVTKREEFKFAMSAGAIGFASGIASGLFLAALWFSFNSSAIFERAQQATQQGALVGAAAANQDPRSHERTVPHLDVP